MHWKLQSDRYDFSSNFLNETGLDLTFQKWFVSFPYENNRKLMLSVIHHGWATNKIFHSRLPKTVFNSIFLLFYLTENHQICILYQKTFIKKRIVLQNCVKNSYLSYAEFRIHAVKDCLCFYKNSANRAFTFISSKIVYCKQHFTY